MNGHRISSLPLAEFCPQAPVLGDKYGAGRAAAVSTAFHAICAGDPDTERALAALTDDERAELEDWHKPAPFAFNGLQYAYSDARTETEVELPLPGGRVALGHVDMWWHAVDGLVIVGDIKRSKWTVPTPPAQSLQLAGYGLALCHKLGADSFLPRIWAAKEGEWIGEEVVCLDSLEGYRLQERVEHAATHVGQAATGPHCDSCWQSSHCPEYLLPAALGEANPDLAALSDPDTTPEAMARALEACKAMETLASAGIKQARLWAQKHGGIQSGDKVWGPGKREGRETVSVKRVRELAPELADKLITRGKSFDVYQWRKVK